MFSYFDSLYIFDLHRFVSWHTVSSSVVTESASKTAMSGLTALNRTLVDSTCEIITSAYTVCDGEITDLSQSTKI